MSDIQFAPLWALDPETVFLNHGSFGACPLEVLEYRAGLQRDLEARPMEFLVRRLPGLLMEEISYAERLSAAQKGSIVFVQNATQGVNTVLAGFGLKPGDEILVGSHEYFATLNACRMHAGRSGAACTIVPMPFPVEDPREITDAFLSRITPRTRLVVIDHVTSATAFVADLAPLVVKLGGMGIEVLVDGAHGPGMLPLDLTSLGAAFYTGNFHKWLCSPKVCAMLYVRPDMQERIHPLATSHLPDDFDSGLSPFHLEFLWNGTPDPTASLCVSRAGGFLSSLLPGGLEEVRESNRTKVLAAREILCNALGVGPPCPDSMVGSMASIELPWIDPPDPALPDWVWMDGLQRSLLEEHRIEVPVIYIRSARKRLLRISAQLYNEPWQFDYLKDCILGSSARRNS